LARTISNLHTACNQNLISVDNKHFVFFQTQAIGKVDKLAAGRSENQVKPPDIKLKDKMKSRKIEPLRLSSKVKAELSASGVFTAAGANAILQKVVRESEAEATEALRRSAPSTDLSASIDSSNFLGDEEQPMPMTEQSVMGKLNASVSSFFISSIEGLRDELDSSHQSEIQCHAKKRNIAPKRSSFHEERTMRKDIKNHRFREVKW